MWQKLHQENAIEAVSINFATAEPIGSLPTKRVLRELESITTAAGFINRAPVQEINVAFDVSRGPGFQHNVLGMVFQRTRLARTPNGQVASIPAQQLQATSTQISYSTWVYRDWDLERAEALSLMRSALKTYFNTAPLASVRLEYLDRFFWDGDRDAFSLDGFLSADSPYLAPHIFQARNVFHSHTGRFDRVNAESRTLLAVNADLQVAEAPHPRAGQLNLPLLTVAETQFPQGIELGENLEEFLESKLNELHKDVIKLFKSSIDTSFAKEHGLPHD